MAANKTGEWAAEELRARIPKDAKRIYLSPASDMEEKLTQCLQGLGFAPNILTVLPCN